MGDLKECPCVFRFLFISVIQNMLNKVSKSGNRVVRVGILVFAMSTGRESLEIINQLIQSI